MARYGKPACIVAELEPPCLFRIDDYWYRLVKHKKRVSIAYVVGQSREVDLDPAQEVTEISVRSLQ